MLLESLNIPLMFQTFDWFGLVTSHQVPEYNNMYMQVKNRTKYVNEYFFRLSPTSHIDIFAMAALIATFKKKKFVILFWWD